MPRKKNVNVGTVSQPCGNLNESNNGNNTNDEGHEIEPNDVQEGHVNMPNGPNVDVGNVNTNTLLCTLLSQNSMLMEMLKSQQSYKSSNEMTIAPDLNKSIPVFNGLATGAQAKDWLRTVNGVANLHRWPDNFKLQSVRANLDGAARHWFMSRDIDNWADFESQFQKTFIGVVMTGDCWKEMCRRVQLRNENVRVYFHEKIYLCKQVGLSFYESKMQVLEGLYSKDLSTYLLGRDHRDEDDLLGDMVEYERLDASRAMRFRQSPANIKDNTVYKPISRLQNDTTASTPIKKETMKTTTTDNEGRPTLRSCFNCGSKEHISPQCPKPKREKGACYECGSMSHQIGSCPGRTRQNPDATKGKQPGLMNIDVTDDDVPPVDYPKPYEVQCHIDVPVSEDEVCEVKFNAVVDTGSPISLLKREFIPNNHFIISPACNSSFYGINGAKLNILGIFETNVTIDNNIIDIRFFIVPNNTMLSDAILGRDLLSKPGFKIEFVNDKINIININNDIIMKEVGDNFDEILCINYDQDESNCNNSLLNINPDLDTEIRNNFIKIYNNEYNMLKENVESRDNNVNFDMKIILKHEQPITFRPRRLSYSEQNKLRIILDELLSEGVIRPSNSAYSSPIVLVKKKSGDYRLCIDYRELNKITVRDNFPTPLIDDQLDRLRDKKIFTLLDLKNGFHHVRMCEKSIPYTSFVTPLGQYEYVRMPFGLTNSPRVFSRFIQFVFHELIRRGDLLVYLDDMMIATRNYIEHFAILKEVFRLAAKHNLQFRLDKCFFGFKEVEYLGYLVNEHGVRPSLKHVEAMLTYPVPKNQKQVRQFLGLASYFRRFIPNFSTVAKPLYDLVKKDKHFVFGDNEQNVFKFLCTTLTESPVLAIYSPDADTELHCDASASGFGAILLQKQTDNVLKPIFYFSQRTSPSESKFHSFELECLAVVYAIKRFHVYLAGITFKVMTDCDSFRLTLSKQEINPRISRWALFLQNYDFSIFHRPNKNMQHVDAFSRCHAILILESNTFEQVLAIRQNTDDDIIKIRDELLMKDSKLFELRNGLVYRKENKNVRFYVPKSMESNIIRTCHDDMAHVGLLKVIENISRVYWFPDMKTKVRNYINNCLKCIEFTVPSGKKEGFLNSIPKGDKPFLTIHIDHLGPLEKTGNKNKFIFVVIDAFTKFVKLYPCRSTKTEEVIRHLRNYFQTYSKPRLVISDRGTSFTSLAFKQFLEDESVGLTLVAAGTPRANGQVEIVNKSVVPMLAKLSESTSKWDRVLNKVEFAINNTIHRSTGQSPSILLFGINQSGDVNDEIRLMLEKEINTSAVNLDEVRTKAAERIDKAQEVNTAQYNSKRKTPTIYTIDDYVMITNVDVTVGHNKKLIPKFRGPYVVRKVLDHDRYVIGDIDGFQVTQRPFETIVGPDRMKMWIKV
ncbi:unnamed protein product [Aphis gossypii]|uniref:RNA-directed DNA polymerase n=1 Tax=Aphis gossypii TaxID=80765 RepID=A0A9P0NFZ9_APHGO|nr:unnamed protein product [Aphis gossypii]